MAQNRNATVDLDFGGGSYRFRLAMGELEELQEATGVGPYHCLRRLLAGDWHVQDVRDTLRLGLIGGGLSANEALKLSRRYVDERPDWIRNATLAIAVLSAALAGAPEEQSSKNVWLAPPARDFFPALQSAPTYPVSRSCLGQDGAFARTDPHKAVGV